MKNREEVFRSTVAQIKKAHGRGSVMVLEDAHEPMPAIPSGFAALDEALGVGGYPKGKIVELFGPESLGKTALVLHAVASAQRSGGLVAFIDAEHAFDANRARALGVDLGKLLVSQPDSAEQALDIVETLTRSGVLDLIVVDSVNALVPRAEIDGDVGDPHLGLQARLMSQALRKLAAATERFGTTIIFVNALRQKIGTGPIYANTEPGGTALKFYASVRLDVRLVRNVETGSRTRVRVVKNKVAAPFKEADIEV